MLALLDRLGVNRFRAMGISTGGMTLLHAATQQPDRIEAMILIGAIVHGDRDEFFPVSIPVEMYQAIPASALWIVPQGGHVPIFGSRAETFLQTALGFLRPQGRR